MLPRSEQRSPLAPSSSLQSCCRSQGSALMGMHWERPCSNRPVSTPPRRGGGERSWTLPTPTSNWTRATSSCWAPPAQVDAQSRHQPNVSPPVLGSPVAKRVFPPPLLQVKRCWRRRWRAAWMSPLRSATAPRSRRPDTWERTSNRSSPNCCRTPTTLWRKHSKVGRSAAVKEPEINVQTLVLLISPLPTSLLFWVTVSLFNVTKSDRFQVLACLQGLFSWMRLIKLAAFLEFTSSGTWAARACSRLEPRAKGWKATGKLLLLLL